MGDMLIHVGGLEPNRIHWLSLRNHKDFHKKKTVSGFFNHPDLKLVLYANHVKKSARGSLKQNCQPPQYWLIFDDS